MKSLTKEQLDNFDYDTYLEKLFGNAVVTTDNPFKPGRVEVRFTVDAKEFRRWKSKGLLGGVYNRDLSNYLSRKGILKFFATPIVHDSCRASKGVKTVDVVFVDHDRFR